MARWHINKHGDPAECRAKTEDDCPLRTVDEHGNLVKHPHYSTWAEASDAAEKENELKFRKIVDDSDRPLNSLSRKHGDDAKTAAVNNVPLPPRPSVGAVRKTATAASSIASVPLPPRPARTRLTQIEVSADVTKGRGMAADGKAAFDSPSVPLPPVPAMRKIFSSEGVSVGTPLNDERPVPAGFLPGLTEREKNSALSGLAARRPDLSYENVMGKPYSAAEASSYGDYVSALEDRLKTDPDGRAALSWAVKETLPPMPPTSSKPAVARSKMWEKLS